MSNIDYAHLSKLEIKLMSKEICTISIGNGWLDNDFTFYEDGSVKHHYDEHPTKPDITRKLKASKLTELTKTKILNNCPEEHKSKIESILTK